MLSFLTKNEHPDLIGIDADPEVAAIERDILAGRTRLTALDAELLRLRNILEPPAQRSYESQSDATEAEQWDARLKYPEIEREVIRLRLDLKTLDGKRTVARAAAQARLLAACEAIVHDKARSTFEAFEATVQPLVEDLEAFLKQAGELGATDLRHPCPALSLVGGTVLAFQKRLHEEAR